MYNYEAGLRAENHFSSLLNARGIQHEFIDKWFDFLVNNKHKVEVKSCRISNKNGNRKSKSPFRIGRFDFTKSANRELQREDDIWVCFIVRFRADFLLLGFCRAGGLEDKRAFSLHKVMSWPLLGLDEWIGEVNG